MRILISLCAALIAAVALVSASGAATTKAQKLVRIDVSTRGAVVNYLRSMHVDSKGLVIQRGARNYAGAHCPGKGWSCTATTHTVVQVAKPGGRNSFSCATGKCRVLQVAATPKTVTNTAKCVARTTGSAQLQVCVIIQLSSTANNLAVVYEDANGSNGTTQQAVSTASIVQRASGPSNSNTACVFQGIRLNGSTTVSKGNVNVALGAHQLVTINQDSAHGGNSASSSATSTGACDTAHPLTQSQTVSSSVTGHGAVTQSENAASLGANLTIDVEQNQSTGFLGSAHGPNAVNFEQDNVLTAIANTAAGPVSQTQSSTTGGLLGTVNQDSRDPSTVVATQHETQCEDAAKSGLATCQTAPGDADFNGTYPLTQTQYGPEGVWQARKHRRGRQLVSVHKGVGTAKQTGNSADTFTLTQTSKQDSDSASGQTNNVQGDCSTSGTCTESQTTNVDGQTTTNTQSGQNLNSGINCTGSSCTKTVPADPVINTFPPNPSNSSTATFTFSDATSPVTFLCSLDGSPYTACSSGQTYTGLSDGPHTFSVEAKDQNGNVGDATLYGWTIAFPEIVFDGSPGTSAPPSTLGPFTMTAFGSDPQPVCPNSGSLVNGVSDSLAGTIGFSQQLSHDLIGGCWATWSNGYIGDVYDTYNADAEDPTQVTITLPSGTEAFYLYAEPQQFEVLTVDATAQDGTTSGPVDVQGNGGAQYFGFYGTGGATLSSITVSTADSTGFAVGEFGISPAADVIP